MTKVYTIDLRRTTDYVRKNNAVAVMAVADLGTGLANLDAAGYKILGVLQKVGFWVVTVKCTYDLIQCALKGDKRAIGGIIITYIIIYGAMFFVPWMLNLVSGIF